MPISTKLFNDQAIARFNALTSDIQTVQGKIATGKQVLKASDDPVAAANISFVRDQKVVLERYQTNIERARTRMTLAEDAVAAAVNVMTRANELAIQARNDTLNVTDRKAIAAEISQLHESLTSIANTRDSAGDALFGGFRVKTLPFAANADGNIAFQGDRGVHAVQISETLHAETSLDGAGLFMRVDMGDETVSAFQVLEELQAELEGGYVNDASIDRTQQVLRHFSINQTFAGAQLSKLNMQDSAIEKRLLLMTETLSGMEDADLAKLVTELQSKIVNRDAAQQAFVKIGQQSLFDYIR